MVFFLFDTGSAVQSDLALRIGLLEIARKHQFSSCYRERSRDLEGFQKDTLIM